jgi:hypothetical protein
MSNVARIRSAASPQSGYRDCEIVIFDPEQRSSPYRAICTDAATGITIGCASIPCVPYDGQPATLAPHVIKMVGGGYRLVSIAIDIEADELSRRTRRISGRLRLRQRLWRRRSRAQPAPAR